MVKGTEGQKDGGGVAMTTEKDLIDMKERNPISSMGKNGKRKFVTFSKRPNT